LRGILSAQRTVKFHCFLGKGKWLDCVLCPGEFDFFYINVDNGIKINLLSMSAVGTHFLRVGCVLDGIVCEFVVLSVVVIRQRFAWLSFRVKLIKRVRFYC